MSSPQKKVPESPGRGRQTVALTLPTGRTVRGVRRSGESLPDTVKRLAKQVVYGIEPDRQVGIYVGWLDKGDTFARVEIRAYGGFWCMDGNLSTLDAMIARQAAQKALKAEKARRSAVGHENAKNYWAGRYRKPAWN